MATEPKPDDTSKPDDKPAKVTAGDLRTWIREEISNVADVITGKGSSKPEDKKTDPASSVADQVRAEVAKLEAKRKAADRDKSIDDQLAELTLKVQPKPPIDRKHHRLHNFMKWGDNE